MTVYLDTSVLVAALTVEPESERAQRRIQQGDDWLVSDWTVAEFSGAIRAKARRGELSVALIPVLDHAIDEFTDRIGGATALRPSDHQSARTRIIMDGKLRAPDALHLVIAERLGAAMFTFDIELARAAREAGLQVVEA
ncbi:type II toxin-antitoxin system VapC family toxin [Brevundimonas aurifodinae]|uniref:Ribonuclease VapC n=1 Tax=Brevundimonas aurifodinae TaxID=1508312 RepID=A0ABV1NIP8_9CAUL